jgi:hypothetical protein
MTSQLTFLTSVRCDPAAASKQKLRKGGHEDTLPLQPDTLHGEMLAPKQRLPQR